MLSILIVISEIAELRAGVSSTSRPVFIQTVKYSVVLNCDLLLCIKAVNLQLKMAHINLY